MGKYIVALGIEARKDLKFHFKSGNKATIKKIEKILLELTEHPFTGDGKPEELKYDYTGYWSRRINMKDRIIYRVEEEIVTVFVISALGHYLDK